jgi:hypothetical protein
MLTNKLFGKTITNYMQVINLFCKKNNFAITNSYNLAERIKTDTRIQEDIESDLLYLIEDAVRLRFRADISVSVCLLGS